MTDWPTQNQCDAFYGNPRGSGDRPNKAWEADNLRSVAPPFRMTYDGKPIKSIRIHKKCAASLSRVLAAIWDAAGRNQATVDAWGASIFAGSYVYRLKRGGGTLSMHAYGCALDLDPERNAFHDTTPNFANIPQVVKAFEDEGWTWGGRWTGRASDGMHFQAAFVSNAARRPNGTPAHAAPPKQAVTVKELRKAGSRTIAGADKAQTGAVGNLISMAAGAEALSQVKDVAAQARDAAATIQSATASLAGAEAWARAHWPLLLLAASGAAILYFSWRAWSGGALAKAARVEDEALGLHIGRL